MEGQYPLDPDVLEKGSVVTAAELIAATGKSPNTDEYRFALLKIKRFIQDAFMKRNPPQIVTVRMSGYDLRILTDSEAAAFNTAHFANGIEQARRAYDQKCGVIEENLTEPEKKIHGEQRYGMGRVLQAVENTTREIHETTAPMPTVPKMFTAQEG